MDDLVFLSDLSSHIIDGSTYGFVLGSIALFAGYGINKAFGLIYHLIFRD